MNMTFAPATEADIDSRPTLSETLSLMQLGSDPNAPVGKSTPKPEISGQKHPGVNFRTFNINNLEQLFPDHSPVFTYD